MMGGMKTKSILATIWNVTWACRHSLQGVDWLTYWELTGKVPGGLLAWSLYKWSFDGAVNTEWATLLRPSEW